MIYKLYHTIQSIERSITDAVHAMLRISSVKIPGTNAKRRGGSRRKLVRTFQYVEALSLAANLEEALPPATLNTLGGAMDALAHTVVILRVVLGMEKCARNGELSVSGSSESYPADRKPEHAPP